MIKQYSKTSRSELSQNFKVYEFACKGKGCCNKVLIDPQLVTYLQSIRTHFGKPVTINSGYRCEKHNKVVGGAYSSQHVKGKACDIVVKGVKPAEVAKYAESIGIKGIGLYDTFVHIDTRTSKSFWYSDKQLKRDTFGGNKIASWQQSAIADGFELINGVNGVWDNASKSVANKAICKKQLVGYKNKNLTKIIQKAVGVNDDGKFGSKTKQAVKTYQKKQGLTQDGIVGYNTWCKILGV